MTHERTTIRNAIVTQLINASITGVGSNVFPTRFKPVFKNKMPLITVYTLSEDVVDNSKAVRFDRELTVLVEAYEEDSATTRTDEGLDNLAEEIEDALKDFKPNCKTIDLVRTEIGIDSDSDTQIGVVRLIYIIRYSTFRGG